MDIRLNPYNLIEKISKIRYNELHIHHTYIPNHSHFNGKNHEALQNGMRNYHITTNGWSDIGQHVTLFPDGVFLTGRDFEKTPASIYDHNQGAFAVEMVGNFDIGHDVLKGEQLNSLLILIKHFIERECFVRFHNENSAKTCPGSSLNKKDLMEMAISKKDYPSDVVGHPLEEAIKLIIDSGIMVGYPDGLFRPDKPLTRAELCAVLTRKGVV